ncbi:MAG: hypothetical protein ACXVRZ_07390 [Gaiellaceae bacterium]
MAAYYLGRWRPSPALLRCLDAKDEKLRRSVLDAFSGIGDPRAFLR